MESVNAETWDDNWSSSSESDDTDSSYSDESSSSLRMEAVRVGGESFLLPQGLCDSSEVFKELFSLDLWNSIPDEQKEHLESFLPSFPENDAEEKNKTIKMLFNRENIRFGNPLDDFHKNLKDGNFRPDVSRLRAMLKKVQYKDYKRSERWRLFKLMKSVLTSRQRLVNAVINGEKPKVTLNLNKKKGGVPLTPNVKSRYFQELSLIKEEVGETTESSEDDNYPEGPVGGLSKKSRRPTGTWESGGGDIPDPVIGTLCSGPTPWEAGGKLAHHNPYHIPDQTYSQMLALHAKRRTSKEDHPDLQTDGISMHEIAQRCKHLKRTTASKTPIVIKKSKVKVKKEPSIPSPMVEEEVNETGSEAEEPPSLMALKMDPDIEEEVENIKVDIESMDDLPSFPIIMPQNSVQTLTSHNSPPPKSSKPPPIRRQARVDSQESLKRSISVGSSTPSTPTFEDFTKKPSGVVVKTSSAGISISPQLSDVREEERQVLQTHQASPQHQYQYLPQHQHQQLTAVVAPPPPPTQVTIIRAEPEICLAKPRLPLTPATLSDLDGIDMMDLPVDFDESPPLSLDDMSATHPELTQDTHSSFFSLIRDILLSTPDHRIEPRDLELRIKSWASSPIAPLNPWYTPDIESRLQSAIMFLTGDASERLPDDYVPYMEWKVATKVYQWIGAGRDSDVRLNSLCSVWCERRGVSSVSSVGTLTPATLPQAVLTTPQAVPVASPAPVQLAPASASFGVQATPAVPPPRGPAVQPSSPHDRAVFRQQEKQRYANPGKAFTYRIGGRESIVGPVRSTQAGNLSKARGHTLLIDDRPKYVTILELVRDAVARLPNAQGTRADIVTLLKDSQYLSESAQEAVLSSVVSGALDRLHYEHDPSVKYDSKRKIWVYLHHGRSSDEHEKMHALGANVKVSRPKSSRKQKPKKDAVPESTEVGTLTDGNTLGSCSPDRGLSPLLSDSPKVMGLQATVAVGTAGSSTVLSVASPSRTAVSLPGKKSVSSSTESGVKTLLGKSTSGKGRQQQQQQTEGGSPIQNLIRVQQQQQQQQQSPQQQQQQGKPATLPQQRTAVQDTALARAQSHNIVKKTVGLSGEAVAKATAAGKSFVKVIASSQAPQIPQSPTNPVRTVQRSSQQQTVSSAGQQILQLKQQQQQQYAASAGEKLVKTVGTTPVQQVMPVKKQSTNQSQQTTQSHQPQQVIVMKQGVSGDGGQGLGQQQMIVINQQQILVDSLSAKHQKQLQQLLSKQHQHHQQQVEQQQQAATSAAQAIQLILGKQQSGGEQTKVVATTGKGPTPMIVVKGDGGKGGAGGGGAVQQMILVKQAAGPGGGGSGGDADQHQALAQQALQQMILVKGTQAGQGSVTTSQGQAIPQQMIIVKQADQKSVQVIPQPSAKGTNQLTLAQFQQLQQQQQQIQQQQLQQLQQQQQQQQSQQQQQQVQQQRVSTTTLLNHPRVVAHATSSGSTTLLKPQVVTTGSGAGASSVVAKVVPATPTSTPIITMESLLSATATKQPVTHQATVRMPVSRTVQPQYAVVSLPQQRVVQTSAVQVSGTDVMATSSQTVKSVAGQSVRIPGLNLAQISGKQVLLASKPAQATTLQGQNVVLGGTTGQALLVSGSSGGQQLALLQQGSQQILLPPGALKNLQGFKMIPLTSGKGLPQGRPQVFARIINPGGARPVVVQQETQLQPPPSTSKD